MSQLLLWRPLASALVAEGPTKREASVSEDRKGNCCDIQYSYFVKVPAFPARRGTTSPYEMDLERECAIERHARPIGVLGSSQGPAK